METVTYKLRVETGSDMVSMRAGDEDCHILSEGGNRQWHGQDDGGQQMETVTYFLRVETNSDMVSIMVGS
jgi:hypothetical protein